ncbi:phage baseplate assembly protein V [Rhodopila sp.]|uniref:phage baseplate assembly protein V n=1 Tax=Rhodopila sp. TaxID=2480087 RepID=UPI003D1443F5
MLDRLNNIVKAHAGSQSKSSGQAKFGTVTSVNYESGNARILVQPEGVLSGWLPILSQWVGPGWGMVCPPSPGDQVLFVPQDGDVEQGVIVGRTYSSSHMPPVAPDGEFWLVHRSGSFLKLCNDGTIQISGELHVQGNIYDQHGSLSGLRQSYNSHTHAVPAGGTTSAPTPTN